MKVMLDNCIHSHAEFMRYAQKNETTRWGDNHVTIPIQGMMRKSAEANPTHQAQKDALFTIGRLIRENIIQAYEYTEIKVERWRSRARIQYGNALNSCPIQECPPALERTKFRNGPIFDMIRKMGKKDHKKGNEINHLGQIPFFAWLLSLSTREINLIISAANQIKLTDFEVDSLKNMNDYKMICADTNNPENYPDAFHIWTAQRSSIQIFLTLDNKLVQSSLRIKKRMPTLSVSVLQPLDLLKMLKIATPDKVPLEYDRFYLLHEIT